LRSASVYIDAAASHSNNLPTYILTTDYYIQVVYDAAADHKHTQNLVLEWFFNSQLLTEWSKTKPIAICWCHTVYVANLIINRAVDVEFSSTACRLL